MQSSNIPECVNKRCHGPTDKFGEPSKYIKMTTENI